MSDSLRPHEPQHVRPPCPSPTAGVYPNPCPLSQWCHPTISSSVVPFFSCPQSFPASGSFRMSQLFTSAGQSIGVSASTSVFPMNTQDWSSLGWTGWISLQSKGLSRVFSNTTVQKHQFFGTQPSSQSNSYIHTFSSPAGTFEWNAPNGSPYSYCGKMTFPAFVLSSGHGHVAKSWGLLSAAKGKLSATRGFHLGSGLFNLSQDCEWQVSWDRGQPRTFPAKVLRKGTCSSKTGT